jgi:RNA polymerase sigma-70 factor (ECF subfamily)
VDREVDAGALARFVSAFETRDAAALIALLQQDAAFSMPPMPLWYRGVADIEAFLRGFLFASGRPAVRLQATRANGCPAFAIYQQRQEGFELVGLDVLVFREGRIAELHAFLSPSALVPFTLPDRLPPRG